MVEIVSKPDAGAILIKDGRATPVFQRFLDDFVLKANGNLLGQSVIHPEYSVENAPEPSDNDNGVIIVSDEVGGRTLATSDGVFWRRVKDGIAITT